MDNLIYEHESQKVKIIDLGFAGSCKEPLKAFCGTPSYIAPEMTYKKEYQGAQADMWAAGVALYAMLTGNLPFKAADEK